MAQLLYKTSFPVLNVSNNYSCIRSYGLSDIQVIIWMAEGKVNTEKVLTTNTKSNKSKWGLDLLYVCGL